MTATHIYGTPCQVEELQQIADSRGIPLVYDAAHALGSRRRGRPVGGFGTAEVFSLSPTKVIMAGEGGLVATHDDDLAARLRIGRELRQPRRLRLPFPGLNARMSELHAAVALAGITTVDERIAHRNELVGAFRDTVQGRPGAGVRGVDEGDVSTFKDLTLVLQPTASA